jgi:hypothetical protein
MTTPQHPLSQQSDKYPESQVLPLRPRAARVLAFERPQSELQKAVQQRAQEDMDLERARKAARVRPLLWVVILVLAAIPVGLMFGALDGFLRAYYRMTTTLSAAQKARTNNAPPAPLTSSDSSTPGVVLLIPTTPSAQQPAQPAADQPTDADKKE